MAQNFHGKGVEEFVGKNDDRDFRGQSPLVHGIVQRGRSRAFSRLLGRSVKTFSSVGGTARRPGEPWPQPLIEISLHRILRDRGRHSAFEKSRKHVPEPVPQFSGAFRQRVVQGVEKPGELFLRPGQHILGKQSAAGAELENFNLRGRAVCPPDFLELASQQASKDGVHVAGGVKVSRLAKLLGMARVVTPFGVVQTQIHITRKRNGTVVADFLFDDLAQAHKPVRWRSARSWGVRMNISTM